MLSHTFNQTATIVTVTRDKYGDQNLSSETSVLCRFRYITELDRNNNREGLEAFDAIIWFAPDENIQEGSIVGVDDKYWRINRLIKARKMSGDQVYFLKAFVKKHEL